MNIEEKLREDGAKSIKKVWVCGPPMMSETFDRVFSSFKDADHEQLIDNSYNYEIL